MFATPQQRRLVGDLREAFEESNLPFRVDLFVWDETPEAFRRQIEAEHVVLVGKQRRCNLANSQRRNEWLTTTIEEIADKVAMGPFGSSIKVETFVPNGIPIISGQHLHETRLDESPGFNFITEEHANRLANSNVFPGDVVFTHAGTIGQVALIPHAAAYGRYVLSQRQFYLRVDVSKADPAFVTHWFHSPVGRHRLLMHASQVGVPSISRPASNLKTIEIELPPSPSNAPSPTSSARWTTRSS